MVEHFPAARLRASSSAIASEFSARLDDTLSLDALVDLFADLAALEGVVGHSCFAAKGEQDTFLFGLPADHEQAEMLSFSIIGWDGEDYRVELALLPGAAGEERRAELHAMSALYVARGLALRDAGNESSPIALSAIEEHCLAQRRAGRCDLDIAEDIGRSVHAVQIHAQRGERKLTPAISSR